MQHILLFTTEQINQLIRKPRGLVVILLFGILWSLWMHYPMAWLFKKSLVTPSLESLFNDTSLTNEEFAGLAKWPSYVTAAIWYIGLFVFPTIPLLVSSDLMVSDLQRGTIRFLTLRASRRSFLLGRFLGQVSILSTFILLAILITTLYLKSWGSITFAKEVGALSLSGLNFLLVSMPILALIALASVFASTPRRAMLWTVLIWSISAWGVGSVIDNYPILSPIGYLIPGHQLTDLVSLYGIQTLSLAPIAIGQSVFFLWLADLLLNRGDM
ncbi:MAG: ABC transporter permease subunit [Bradymonadia bacterium]